MNMDIQNLGNTREEAQYRIMEELSHTGECFLCKSTVLRIARKYPRVASTPLHEWSNWFVKHNDFPYEGTKLHLLVIPERHVTQIEDLTPQEFLEVQQIVGWVNTTFNVQGASLFLRYGDMSYTGATGTHLHFHILHGDKKHEGCESIKPKLGYKCRK